MDEKDIEMKLEEDKLLAMLKNNYEYARRYYARDHKRMRLLDGTDKGDLWKAIRAKFPPYQLLPDTNYVSYVKSNILASLYTVSKSAQLIPTCEEDVAFCERMNIAIEHDWDKNDVAYYMYQAGDRAALLNVGYTQVYWNEEKKQVGYKNIDPMHFMRDPNAEDLQSGGYCMVYKIYDKSWFLNSKTYKDVFKEKIIDEKILGSTEMPPDYNSRPDVGDSGRHYVLFIHWIRNCDGGIDEIHTINNEILLLHRCDIKPDMYPFAELYCNLPGSSLIGSSEPAKIFANNLVTNLMDSIAYTSEYKNQRPPKFVSSQSGLNLAAFAKHGYEADRTFTVNGDARNAVHYHEFPQVSPQLAGLQQRMDINIKAMSGVDDKYTGRDTGSIITTGGTEEMLNRVTLIDTPKVLNYERYARVLTELTVRTMAEYSPDRTYIVVDDERSTPTKTYYKTIKIEADEMDPDAVFEYAIQISSELPKNKQRLQAWANNLMEKQMQYQQAGMQVDLMTPQEWLQHQDTPYRERMLKRMGIQAGLNAYMEAENVVAEYAALLENGALPDEAMQVAADGLQNMRQGEPTPYQEMMGENAGGMGDSGAMAGMGI